MVCSFIVAIPDGFFGLDSGSVIAVSPSHVDVIILMYRRWRRPGWNRKPFLLLSKTLIDSKTRVHEVYAEILTVENMKTKVVLAWTSYRVLTGSGKHRILAYKFVWSNPQETGRESPKFRWFDQFCKKTLNNSKAAALATSENESS